MCGAGGGGQRDWLQDARTQDPHRGKRFPFPRGCRHAGVSAAAPGPPWNIPTRLRNLQSAGLPQSRRLQETDVCPVPSVGPELNASLTQLMVHLMPLNQRLFHITNMLVATFRVRGHHKQSCGCFFFCFEAGGVLFPSTSTALLSLNDVFCESILICVC